MPDAQCPTLRDTSAIPRREPEKRQTSPCGAGIRTKTIHSVEHTYFLNLVRQVRERQGLTQEQLAEKLGANQSFVSKCERGEWRIDVIELQAFCQALDVDVIEFMIELQERQRSR